MSYNFNKNNDNQTKSLPTLEEAATEPLIDSTPNPDYISLNEDCVGSHSGNEVLDIFNS